MNRHTLHLVNRILLGLVMIIPGLMKLFILKPSGVAGMLSGIILFAWAPVLWTWILMAGEIFAGISILTKWNVHIGSWIASVILVVAAFTVYLGNVSNLLVHLALASNYLLLAHSGK